MRIKSIRVRNYRSFADSRSLSFGPGFNVVVGANNVGKSSLLLCLSTKFEGDPHRSIETLPSRDEPISPTSRVDFELEATGSELRKSLLRSGPGDRYLPWHQDFRVDDGQSQAFLNFLLAGAVPVHATALAPTNSGPAWLSDDLSILRGSAVQQNEKFRMLRVDVTADRTLVTHSIPSVPAGRDFGHNMVQAFTQEVYRFSAERLNVGTSPHGPNDRLASDARNLPEVLNILQSNPERFRKFSEYVTEIFPTITKVTVRPAPSSNGAVEILVWQLDPKSERDDLAMPLARCGTGVGQVLAMLYVAKTSEQARTIIIDEPGSFLHPGAARALIRILKQFPQHQYIIATHSPEIIAELSDAPVSIVKWENGKSKVDQFDESSAAVASLALAEIGAKLSDVFGFDRVLWVEGQSDASTLVAILELAKRAQRQLAILPVRNTGAFQRRKLAEVIGIYRTLAMGGALLPPAALFLFDRDGRSTSEIQDLERESKGQIRFLTRRMIENYLLHIAAIAELISVLGEGHDVPAVSTTDVHQWVIKNGNSFAPNGTQVLSEEWLRAVDGAKLLARAVSDLSDQRLEYRKVIHTPMLARIVFKHDREAVMSIVGIVADVLE
jgi:hypothetical protein